MHRFRDHFGTLLASSSVLVGDCFFHDFSDGIFPFFVRKCSPKGFQMATEMAQERCKKATRNHAGRHIRFLARLLIKFGKILSDFGSILEGFSKDFGVVILSIISCV